MAQRSALQIANSGNNRSPSTMVHWLSQQKETKGSIARGLLTLDRLKSWCASRFHTWPFNLPFYINDIVRNINSSIRLFADDTSLYIIVENPIQAATILNSDLSQIYSRASNWLVTFNTSKTESLLFSQKLFKPLHPTLYMNQQDIITIESHKHLSIAFTNDLLWHKHLNNVKTKAWQRINVRRKLKFLLNRKSLQIVYFSSIRPLLEYADVVWDNCTQYEANELDKIQHEAARIVSGATKLVSIEKILKEVGWYTLSCRRKNINKYFCTKC